MTSSTEFIRDQIASNIQKVKQRFSGEDEIISMIKEDHKPLKECIQIMKDSEKTAVERVAAFKEFAPMLMTHAKAEEKALYEMMKTVKDLREHAFEGDAEHSMADQLCEEIKRTMDQDQLLAKIKVLAEAVEHHIKEEENDILPDVEKHVEKQALKTAADKYIQVQAEIISEGQDDSPHEAEIKH